MGYNHIVKYKLMGESEVRTFGPISSNTRANQVTTKNVLSKMEGVQIEKIEIVDIHTTYDETDPNIGSEKK